MLKWFALLVAAGAARMLWVWRSRQLARLRLQAFLAARGVEAAVVSTGGHSGWPVYFIDLHSEDERTAFRGSQHHAALLDEVNQMHDGLWIGGYRFDPEQAVILRVRPVGKR